MYKEILLSVVVFTLFTIGYQLNERANYFVLLHFVCLVILTDLKSSTTLLECDIYSE